MNVFFHKYGNLVTGIGLYIVLILLGYYTIIGKNIERGVILRLPVQLTTSEGLKPGAKVFVQGVEVGSVGSLLFLELDQDGWPREFHVKRQSYGQTVIAVLHLKKVVPFYENYKIKTKHATILSAKIVEITPGHAIINTDTNNKDFDHKKSFEKINPITLNGRELYNLKRFGRLSRKNGKSLIIAKNYDDPLFQIAKVMQENRRDLITITTDLKEISQKLNKGNGSIARVVNQPVLMVGVNDLLKEIIVLTNEAGTGVEDLRETESVVNFLELILAFSGALF